MATVRLANPRCLGVADMSFFPPATMPKIGVRDIDMYSVMARLQDFLYSRGRGTLRYTGINQSPCDFPDPNSCP